jgi:hypothetical protein
MFINTEAYSIEPAYLAMSLSPWQSSEELFFYLKLGLIRFEVVYFYS